MCTHVVSNLLFSQQLELYICIMLFFSACGSLPEIPNAELVTKKEPPCYTVQDQLYVSAMSVTGLTTRPSSMDDFNHEAKGENILYSLSFSEPPYKIL